MILYPDQLDNIKAVSDAYRSGHRRVLLQAATGSGKSVMAASMIQKAALKGKHIKFIVPRRELLRQMCSTFDNFQIPHGVMAAGHKQVDKPVMVCSLDSMRARDIGRTDFAIIDETHYGGEGLNTLIDRLGDAYLLGLSATPWKLSGQGLGCWYDHMVKGLSIRELIDAGRLSDYRAFSPSSPDLHGVSVVGGDYDKGQLSDRMRRDRVLTGNAVQHYKKHAMGKLAICYCVSIEHSKETACAFNMAGIPAAHIDGTTPDIERKRLISEFANGIIKILTNCSLLTFGFDLAAQVDREDITVECVIDLDPTKSLSRILQKWGRVLRRKDTPAIILDHAGNIEEHGLPCEDREWTLSDRERKKAGKSDAPPVRKCPVCYHDHRPADKCPNCDHIYQTQSREIDEVEGDLDEITVALNKRVKRMEVGQARTRAELERIAKERNYNPGWVFRQCQLKGIQHGKT